LSLKLEQISMNKEKLYDLTYLNEISGGDEAFVQEMINQFIEIVPGIINRLYYFYTNKDWKALASEAHKFSPNLAFVGLQAYSHLLDQIEQLSNSEVDKSAIQPLISHTEQVCNEVIIQLKQDF
jgi:HPt (histidine-containing phosphotransfer) domain-containing protein